MRSAIESLYMGICTVTNTQDVVNPITKRTTHKDVVICENQPCRVSFSSSSNASQSDTMATAYQIIKLFIAPELDIKAGSKIVVTQNNRTSTYKSSGIPAVYTNHQEITLIDDDKGV